MPGMEADLIGAAIEGPERNRAVPSTWRVAVVFSQTQSVLWSGAVRLSTSETQCLRINFKAWFAPFARYKRTFFYPLPRSSDCSLPFQ